MKKQRKGDRRTRHIAKIYLREKEEEEKRGGGRRGEKEMKEEKKKRQAKQLPSQPWNDCFCTETMFKSTII